MKNILFTIFVLFTPLMKSSAQDFAFVDSKPKQFNTIYERETENTLQKKLNKYLANQVKYPQIALDNQIECVVKFSCNFDKDGKIIRIDFERHLDAYIEKEIIKTLDSMPLFVDASNQKITTTLQFRLK